LEATARLEEELAEDVRLSERHREPLHALGVLAEQEAEVRRRAMRRRDSEQHCRRG
jgi:predicted NUDIX family phosphoesterase